MSDFDFTCTLAGGKWFCPHDCDDPSHGRPGTDRVYIEGRYYRDGGLISATDI